MSAIQAIETRYKGYRFRSRLEARWAVFFDQAGIRYEYEKEGFVTRHGGYLPDFWLPDIKLGLWLEVKSLGGDSEDASITTDKLTDVCTATGGQGVIVRGDPLESVSLTDTNAFPGVRDWSAWALIQGGSDGGACDAPYVFCVCPYCGAVGLEFDGRGARVCFSHPDGAAVYDHEANYVSLGHGDKADSHNHPKLMNAAIAARSARFEYGESGARA